MNIVICRRFSPLFLTLLLLLALVFPAIAAAPIGGLSNQNTYDGDNTLSSLTSGAQNTAAGYNALHAVTAGNSNTALGALLELPAVTAGNSNTALGALTLQSTTGGGNIAVGAGAGVNITTGNFNIDIGNQGVSGDSSTIRIGDSNQTSIYL